MLRVWEVGKFSGGWITGALQADSVLGRKSLFG